VGTESVSAHGNYNTSHGIGCNFPYNNDWSFVITSAQHWPAWGNQYWVQWTGYSESGNHSGRELCYVYDNLANSGAPGV
jgi:hypothetical protein